MQIDFKFNIGDSVVLLDNGKPGKVEAFHVSKFNNIEVAVRYMDSDGAICSVWVKEDELRAWNVNDDHKE